MVFREVGRLFVHLVLKKKEGKRKKRLKKFKINQNVYLLKSL